MKSALITLGLVSVTCLLVACQPGPKAAVATNVTPSTASTAPVPPAIDESLKTDGYNYYGLGNTKDLTFSVNGGGDAAKEGTQKVVFNSASADGGPIFTLKHEGALINMGDEEVQLKKDGIYLVSSNYGKVTPPMMILPAKADVGVTWQASNKITNEDGSSFTVNATYTIAAKEKVKVPAGEFDAIKVVAKGTIDKEVQIGNGKTSTQKSPMDATEWDAPGIGTVKDIATITDEKNRPNTSTVELVKVD